MRHERWLRVHGLCMFRHVQAWAYVAGVPDPHLSPLHFHALPVIF